MDNWRLHTLQETCTSGAYISEKDFNSSILKLPKLERVLGDFAVRTKKHIGWENTLEQMFPAFCQRVWEMKNEWNWDVSKLWMHEVISSLHCKNPALIVCWRRDIYDLVYKLVYLQWETVPSQRNLFKSKFLIMKKNCSNFSKKRFFGVPCSCNLSHLIFSKKNLPVASCAEMFWLFLDREGLHTNFEQSWLTDREHMVGDGHFSIV